MSYLFFLLFFNALFVFKLNWISSYYSLQFVLSLDGLLKYFGQHLSPFFETLIDVFESVAAPASRVRGHNNWNSGTSRAAMPLPCDRPDPPDRFFKALFLAILIFELQNNCTHGRSKLLSFTIQVYIELRWLSQNLGPILFRK